MVKEMNFIKQKSTPMFAVTMVSGTISFSSDGFSLEQYNMITVTVTASNVFGESNTTEISMTCVRLTDTNQALLSLGVVLSGIALLGCVILVVLIVKKGKVLCILL